MNIRSLLALCVALVLATGSAPLHAQKNNNTDKSKQQPKRSKTEQNDVDVLYKAVDAVATGQPAPSDVPVTWHSSHFVKGMGGTTYVPFTVTIDKSKLPKGTVAMYIRVADKNMAPPPAPAAPGKDSKDNKQAPPLPVKYAWDDVRFFDVPQDGIVSKAVQVPAGEYDFFIAVKDKSTDEKNTAPPKIGVLRQSVTVPDFTKAELQTSSIILARSLEPQSTPIKAEDQQDNPYVFGPLKIVPSADGKFPKSAELNVMFWVYGAAEASGGKPDVQLDYNFYQKLPAGEKYFNKTAPQALNASTLPPEFSIAAGHQLTGSLTVPLMSFPEGNYRLEIKVTDKAAQGKTVTQNVDFTVAAS